MENKSMFIKTKDEETSEALKAEGFRLIDYTSVTWTFLYEENRPMAFDDKKIIFSNKLCF